MDKRLQYEEERQKFEEWLKVKPSGAAHEFGWQAWLARSKHPSIPEPLCEAQFNALIADTLPTDAPLLAYKQARAIISAVEHAYGIIRQDAASSKGD